MKQSRRYCFTWNNYTDVVISMLERFAADHARYLVYGKEIAPTTLTPHLQGFFILKKTHSIISLRKLGIECHLEVAAGTSQQASDYCKEDGDFTEFGVLSQQGKRTDLDIACKAIKDGQSLTYLAETYPTVMVKFGRGLTQLKLHLDKPYTHDSVRGIWYYGPPGVGKSYKARMDYPDAFIKSQNKWFDGYAGEAAIILDDLDSNCLGHLLKIWSDRYACTGETKGGTVNLRHHVFIVTSNYAIEDLWKDDLVMAHAIRRRFKVFKCTKKAQEFFGGTQLEE